MFGITVEKLFVIGLVAAVFIGPSRLPFYTQKLAEWLGRLRDYLGSTSQRMRSESGLIKDQLPWSTWDPRQYDPRRIIREALESSQAGTYQTPDADPGPAHPQHSSGEHPPMEHTRPGRYVVTGSSAHPRRVFIPDPEPAARASADHHPPVLAEPTPQPVLHNTPQRFPGIHPLPAAQLAPEPQLPSVLAPVLTRHQGPETTQ